MRGCALRGSISIERYREMSKIKITQVRSVIGSQKRQRQTMEALGLRRMHQTVEHQDSPVVRGMLAKVQHMVTVEEAGE